MPNKISGKFTCVSFNPTLDRRIASLQMTNVVEVEPLDVVLNLNQVISALVTISYAMVSFSSMMSGVSGINDIAQHPTSEFAASEDFAAIRLQIPFNIAML